MVYFVSKQFFFMQLKLLYKLSICPAVAIEKLDAAEKSAKF